MQIDTDDMLARQRAYWADIRVSAAWALGFQTPPDDLARAIRDEHAGRPYRYADRAGRVHDCRTLTRLAEVTRSERAWCDATWPEDR